MPIPVDDDPRVVSVEVFASYLNNPAVLTDPRAVLILDLAQSLCETIISPLPTGAETVVLDVAERAYANPTNSGGSRGLALYEEGVGAFSDNSPGMVGGGLWLTKNNETTLRRLAGGSSAFSADLTPAAAAQSLPWWDVGSSWNGW